MKKIEEYVRTVTHKGQVTIPVSVRRLLEVGPGGKVVFLITEGTVQLLPVTTTLKETFKAVRPKSRPEDLAALRDIALEEHAQAVASEMKE